METDEEPTGLRAVLDLILMPWRMVRQEGRSLIDFSRAAKDTPEAFWNPEVEWPEEDG